MPLALQILSGVAFGWLVMSGYAVIGKRLLDFADIGAGNDPWIVRIVVGSFPILLFTYALSSLFWNSEAVPRYVTLAIWIFRGLIALLGALHLRDLGRVLLTDRLGPSVLVLLVLFTPSIFLRGGLHPTWDYDAVLFWMNRVFAIAEDGLFRPTNMGFHLTYASTFCAWVGHLIPTGLDRGAQLVLFRFHLVVVISACLSAALRDFGGWLYPGLAAIFLSGFPTKLVSGEQDGILGFIVLVAVSLILSERARLPNFLKALLLLSFAAGIKNEGAAFAVLFTVLALVFFSIPGNSGWRADKINFKFLALLSIALFPTLAWKLSSSVFHLQNDDLAFVPLSWDEFIRRWNDLFGRLPAFLLRKQQSYYLEALISLTGLALMFRKLGRREIFVLAFGVGAVLIPCFVVTLTPKDWDWHIRTTIMRITFSGIFSLMLVFFHVLLGSGDTREAKV